MTDIAYGRKVIESPNDDGTTTIRTEGYYHGQLATTKIEIRQDIDTNQKDLPKDLFSCLDVIHKTDKGLKIEILKDKYGKPFLIQKTWTEIKEGKPLPKNSS